jgi:hypothetical protein
MVSIDSTNLAVYWCCSISISQTLPGTGKDINALAHRRRFCHISSDRLPSAHRNHCASYLYSTLRQTKNHCENSAGVKSSGLVSGLWQRMVSSESCGLSAITSQSSARATVEFHALLLRAVRVVLRSTRSRVESREISEKHGIEELTSKLFDNTATFIDSRQANNYKSLKMNNNQTNTLKFKERFGYGLGDTASNFSFRASTYFYCITTPMCSVYQLPPLAQCFSFQSYGMRSMIH